MGFEIKNKVLPNGFNRRTVIIAIVVVAIIIAGFVIYAVTNNTTGGGIEPGREQKKVEINDNNANVSAILDIVNSKPSASKVAGSILNKASESIALSNGANGNLSVPPIMLKQQAVENEYDKQAKNIETQAKLKKLQAQYSALDAKSSMTSGTSKDNTSNAKVSQIASGSNKANASSGNNNTSPGGGATTYLDSELIKPKSPYLLQAGSIIPCVMISGINSDLSGQVIAITRENVYDSISSRYLLIPQGAKLIGTFSNQVAYGQERLGVAWSRVIYPNGYSIDLKGIPGSDVAGFSGFYDQVDNHYWKIFGSSFVIGMITAGMQYSQNNTNPNVQVGGLGVTTNPTIGQTISGSLGQQLGQTAMMVTQKGLSVAPTLTIRQGYMFTIMLTADIALKPYRQSAN